jgi:hypothetical protein
MRKWFTLIGLGFVCSVLASDLPPNLPEKAKPYWPILIEVQQDLWKDAPDVALLGSQIEQETCPSLKHSKCWNPRAELKTSREYGFGLGQLTVTPRFNNFVESQKWDVSLRGWTWEDRYNPVYQLRAVVAYMRNLNIQVKGANSDWDRYAMALSAYNGGLGGLNKDRVLCKNTKGCDSTKWFGHVEKTSLKAKTSVHGYGKSFFEINREYVRNVMIVRIGRYRT